MRSGDNGQPRYPQKARPFGKAVLSPQILPALNPIEQVFAELKHLLRKAAARTLEAVVVAIRHLLDAYTPKNAPTTSPTKDTRKPENIPL
jgi:hypothetical protein